MVVLCFLLIWFGLRFRYGFGYGFDMILMWFGNGAPFSGFPVGWFQERKQKQPRDSLLVDVSRVFVVLLWLDTVLIRFDFDYGWLVSKTPQGHVCGRFLEGFLVLICFYTVLIQF